MTRLLIFSLLALTAANALAGNMYIYKDKGGQVLLTNVNPSGNFDKLTKKVKVTYYRDDKSSDNSELNQKQTVSGETQNVSYGTSSSANSDSYKNSAYLTIR